MRNPATRVTFIGLGNMGQPMAASLLRAGFDLTVWNRTASRIGELMAAGAKRAATIADAARADIIITMVADDAALEDIVVDGQLIEVLPRGGIHVSMSTISVAL